MSHSVNTSLFERAAEMITYFEGKLPAQVLEQDLDNNDLGALFAHTIEAESEAARQEFHNADIC